MLILDLWGISFHPVIVVGLGNDLLFNFIVGRCVYGRPLVKPSDHENLPFIGSSLALKLVGRFLSIKVCGLFRLRVSACPISSPLSPSESESTTRKGCFITLTDFSFLATKLCFFKLDLFLLKGVGALDLPVMHVKNNDSK